MVYKSDKGKVKSSRRPMRPPERAPSRAVVLVCSLGSSRHRSCRRWRWARELGRSSGKAHDRGISDDLIKQAGKAIETSGAVVFVLADQANTAVIAKLIDEAAAGGASVEYQVLSEDAQDLLRMQIKTGDKVAVGVQVDFKGMTLEQYDEVIYRMGFEPRGAGGPGSLFHLVTKTADGIRVTDVWETQEDFEKFSEEKIGPITQEVGIQGQPEIQYFDVHNYLTGG